MDAHEEALAKLEEDKTRVQGEISKLDAECAAIDADLAETYHLHAVFRLELKTRVGTGEHGAFQYGSGIAQAEVHVAGCVQYVV